MPVQTEPRAWIVCPCSQDPNFDIASAQFTLSPIPEVSPAGLDVRLTRRPRLGTLLTVEFLRAPQSFSAPTVARVSALEHDPEGWLAHCEWVEPMTAPELAALLGSATGILERPSFPGTAKRHSFK